MYLHEKRLHWQERGTETRNYFRWRPNQILSNKCQARGKKTKTHYNDPSTIALNDDEILWEKIRGKYKLHLDVSRNLGVSNRKIEKLANTTFCSLLYHTTLCPKNLECWAFMGIQDFRFQMGDCVFGIPITRSVDFSAQTASFS